RAQRGASCAISADDLSIEDIGQNLAPNGALRPAARGANLVRLNAKLAQPVQAVVQAQGCALHRSACEMTDVVGLFAQTEIDASAVGHVWCTFAFEEGNQQQ